MGCSTGNLDAGARASLPRTEQAVVAAAAALGFSVPAACIAGVVANLALLDDRAATLRGAAAAA